MNFPIDKEVKKDSDRKLIFALFNQWSFRWLAIGNLFFLFEQFNRVGLCFLITIMLAYIISWISTCFLTNKNKNWHVLKKTIIWLGMIFLKILNSSIGVLLWWKITPAKYFRRRKKKRKFVLPKPTSLLLSTLSANWKSDLFVQIAPF